MVNASGSGDGWANSTNLTSFFTFGLGIVAGSCLAVLTKDADPGGDYLKIYLSVVTAMLGAALGLSASRLMDYVTDRRRVRRRTQVARLYIQEMLSACRDLLKRIPECMEDGRLALKHGEYFHENRIVYLLDALDAIYRSSATPPALEEVIETAEDLEHAKAVGMIFKRTRRADTEDMHNWELKKQHFFVLAYVGSNTLKEMAEFIATLEAADRHFEKKLG